MLAQSHPPALSVSEDQLKTLQPSSRLIGSIKRCANEFIVDETLGFEPAGEGEHIYLRIEKQGANTGWVAYQLAQFLDLGDVDVSYAGRKDRHALTRQWFSCYLPVQREIDWNEFKAEGVTIKSVTRHRSKLRRGQLQDNAFQIVVHHRALNPSEHTELIHRLATMKTSGFPNYFGTQRFGRDGQNLIVADKLLRLKEKVRGNRGLYISAARSWLFNVYLSSQIEEGADLAGQTGPLIGKSRDPQAGEEQLGEVEQAWVAGLRRLGSKVGSRDLLVYPAEFEWEMASESITLKFKLGPGGYATSLLRELFTIEDASL